MLRLLLLALLFLASFGACFCLHSALFPPGNAVPYRKRAGRKTRVCSQALPAPNSTPSTSKPASKQVPSSSHLLAASPLSPSLPVDRGQYLKVRSKPGLSGHQRLALLRATTAVCEGKQVGRVPGKHPDSCPSPSLRVLGALLQFLALMVPDHLLRVVSKSSEFSSPRHMVSRAGSDSEVWLGGSGSRAARTGR